MRNLVAAALTLALLGGVATAAQADERPFRVEQRDHDKDHDKDDHRSDDRNQDRNQDRDGKNDDDKDRDWRRDDRFDNRNDHDRDSGHDYRRDDRHDDYRRDYHGRYDHDHHRYGHYVKPDGYRYRAWHHGDHLPRSYRSSRYIVNDYPVYRLRPPPRGYHWIRVDNDVILVAIATGLVAQAIYGVF